MTDGSNFEVGANLKDIKALLHVERGTLNVKRKKRRFTLQADRLVHIEYLDLYNDLNKG